MSETICRAVPRKVALMASLFAFMLLCSQAFAITLSQLQNDIQYVINQSNSNVQWSVKIENATGSGDFFSLNATTMRRPASNTKIFTTAAAFRKFGPSYVWNGYQLGSSSTASPVHAILSDSDNTYADSLFSTVGGETAALQQIAAMTSTTGMNMDDGSGLNYNNRFNCEQTIDVVRYMMNTYTYSQWGSHLAISCTDGTLASRLCSTGQVGRVHAKTGTLTNGLTLSLSGYVDNQYDSKRYYFSIYANNVPSAAQTDTRNRIDTIVGYMCQSGLPTVGLVDVIVDNTTSGSFTASTNWATGTNPGFYGTNYRVRATAATSDAATWSATLPTSGSYKVYARWVADPNRSITAPYIVYHTGGSTTVNVNQRLNNGTWVLLGTFNMNAGTANRVALSCWTSNGSFVVADAVRFEQQ